MSLNIWVNVFVMKTAWGQDLCVYKSSFYVVYLFGRTS